MALVVGAAGWRQADLVTVAGRVTANGRPLDEATLTFTGESGRIVVRTSHDGRFRLPLVRPGLYAISAPGRVAVPEPRPEKEGRGVAQRPEKTSRKQPGGLHPVPRGPDLHWIEIPMCSRYDELIELSGSTATDRDPIAGMPK
jgi:hypothetical protein